MKQVRIIMPMVAVLWACAAVSSRADLVIAQEGGSTAPGGYGSTFFSGIDLQVGDYLVVGHANNKRNGGGSGGNTISLSLSGTANTFSSVASGDGGVGSGTAWLFYSQVTEAGSGLSLVLNTSNASTTTTHATWFAVLRPGAGESILIADTASIFASTNPGVSSLSLDYDFGATTFSGGLGIVVASTQSGTGGNLADPSGWSLEQAGNNKREIYSLAGYTESTLDPSIGNAITTDMAAAGAVFYVVPEPSMMALVATGLGLMAWRRRRA